MKHEIIFASEEADGLLHVSAVCRYCKWNGGTVRPARPGRTLADLEAEVAARHEDWRGLPEVQEFESAFGKLDEAERERVEAAALDYEVRPLTLAEVNALARGDEAPLSEADKGRGEIEKLMKAEGLPSLWAGADARLEAAPVVEGTKE